MWARKRFEPATDQLNGDGSLLSGLIAALADQMLAFAAMTVVPGDHLFRTTNLSVSFFKLSKRQPIDIEARVIAQSRQLIHVRVDFCTTEGVLLAEASAQQVLTKIGA